MRIDMSENEARRYERATVLVVPVEPQPSIGSVKSVEYRGDGFFLFRCENSSSSARCPVRPGDVLNVAEPFAYRGLWHAFGSPGRWGDRHGVSVSFQADGDEILEADWHNIEPPRTEFMLIRGMGPLEFDFWRPASEMPDWVMELRPDRHHPTVTSVTAKMLGQLTEEDVIAAGIEYTGDRIQDGARCSGAVSVLGAFRADWTADHGEWQPSMWVLVIGIEKGATT